MVEELDEGMLLKLPPLSLQTLVLRAQKVTLVLRAQTLVLRVQTLVSACIVVQGTLPHDRGGGPLRASRPSSTAGP